MVDDIKNDRFELEDKSEGYSSMEIPEPKVVAAEPEVEAAVEAASKDMGREGDSMVVRASPFTIKLLQDIGGAGSFNPETGMLEFYGLDDAIKKNIATYGNETARSRYK